MDNAQLEGTHTPAQWQRHMFSLCTSCKTTPEVVLGEKKKSYMDDVLHSHLHNVLPILKINITLQGKKWSFYSADAPGYNALKLMKQSFNPCG